MRAGLPSLCHTMQSRYAAVPLLQLPMYPSPSTFLILDPRSSILDPRHPRPHHAASGPRSPAFEPRSSFPDSSSTIPGALVSILGSSLRTSSFGLRFSSCGLGPSSSSPQSLFPGLQPSPFGFRSPFSSRHTLKGSCVPFALQSKHADTPLLQLLTVSACCPSVLVLRLSEVVLCRFGLWFLPFGL
jgi:hypothetical protein